ncbi:hypothetical protein B566_EDAN014181 [Ephemera danica]|nr:hypothetical protein B566_EDAN014181 [Ephemera danica]
MERGTCDDIIKFLAAIIGKQQYSENSYLYTRSCCACICRLMLKNLLKTCNILILIYRHAPMEMSANSASIKNKKCLNSNGIKNKKCPL